MGDESFYPPEPQDDMAVAARVLLEHLPAFDPDSQHSERTAERFAKMLLDMTTQEHFDFTTFDDTSEDMVTLGPIPFYALCAHHVVPFYGASWVGYVPNGRLVGLSKIPRAVQQMSKGLWVQENLTSEIADFLEAKLAPAGVAVVMKAEHLCMAMRGVKAPGVYTTTSRMLGVFSDHSRLARSEFLSFIDHAKY